MAIAVWATLLLGLSVFSYRFPWSHTVYDIYARACQRWWTGQDMYRAVGTDYYRYSPLFAISMTPWASLPDSWGGALWRIFSGLVYATGLRAWADKVLPERFSQCQRAILFLLVLPLSVHSMHNGQANVVMLGALLLGLAAASGEKWNQAAGWLALATLIKGYPLALALLLAALFPCRFAGRYAIALMLGLLLPFAMQRPDIVIAQYLSWMEHLRESTVIMRERLRTVEHLFSIYNHPLPPNVFLLVQMLAGLAVLILCLVATRRTSALRRRLYSAFELFTCWVVLFGPATETCTYIIIAPVIAWNLINVFTRPTAWIGRLWLILSFLMMGPLVTDLAIPRIRDFANEHGSQPIGALLFLGYALVHMIKLHQVCYLEGVESFASSRTVSHAQARL
jgi:hypothetical protein